MKKSDIETGIHYPYSLNVLPAYAHLNQGKGSFPEAEHTCGHMLSLPIFPAMMREEVDFVCKTVRTFYSQGH